MNQNQVKGTAKDIAGKVQREVGNMTDNTEQQIKGGAKQVEGKVQKGVGDAEQAVDRARDDMKRNDMKSEADRQRR